MKYASSLIPLLALAACAPRPPHNIDEQLAGKSPEERRVILHSACLVEAEHLNHWHAQGQESPQSRRLKDLCAELAKQNPPTK